MGCYGGAPTANSHLVTTTVIFSQPKTAADLDIFDQVLHGAGLVPLPLRRSGRTGGNDAGKLGVCHVADKVEGEVDDSHDAQPRRR